MLTFDYWWAIKDKKMLSLKIWLQFCLNIVAHNVKYEIIKFDYIRFGKIASRHFHAFLKLIILYHGVLLKKPEHVLKNSTNSR